MNLEKDQLYWEKHRPQNLEEMVLLPRIKKIVENGVESNLLFVGSPGIGKTTLAEILRYKYHNIKISTKMGVDVLRTKVDNFCRKMADPLQDVENDQYKIVYLDEFDSSTTQLQDELRSFIETHQKNVRFIATANNIHHFSDAILSRFDIIKFEPQNNEERKFLKNELAKKLINISKKDELNVSKENIKQIVKETFPDFRKSIQLLRLNHLSEDDYISFFNMEGEEKELFNKIISNEDQIQIWEYLYKNWYDRFETAFSLLGKNLFYWLKENYPDMKNNIGYFMVKVAEYTDTHLPYAHDPFVTLFALIIELKKLFNQIKI